MEYPPNYGHVTFDRMRLFPDRIFQIDAATGEEESYGSVLNRSIRLAQALRAFGLSPGDVVAISGRNHIDICIPFFAALFNGSPIVGIDTFYKYDEVRAHFERSKPKIIFCQNELCDTFATAAASLSLDIKFVTFDEGDNAMSKFLQMYQTSEPTEIFKVAEYDIEEICPFLVCTSGTTGKLKIVAIKNKPLLLKDAFYTKYSDKSRISKSLFLSPNHWMSFFFAPTLIVASGGILLLTSKYNNFNYLNVLHVTDIIKKYRPECALFCMMQIPSILLEARKNEVDIDMTSLRLITIAGGKLFDTAHQEFKKLLADNCRILELYGQTETIGAIFNPSPLRSARSCGVPTDMHTVKLIDPDTGVEIKEANVIGELLVKGPCFSGYYNDPEETAKAFTEDGFYKSGDLLYRDKDNNYFFVDRLKASIKYRGTRIYPLQLEEVIREHPGVADVCVVGIDGPVELQKIVACIVKHKGSDVTAQEIKDLVASKLSENKKLWGGVLYVDKLPYTSTGKVLKGILEKMTMTAERE
ncbi:luciferin 4-monooxygenase [Bicyclus anynana]|uniref:Luciferin 4-monooxygenase n=1 Tax=Bicyclus anynana TaxID=110368 RepID=A0A6J1MUT1_BICAN|nr:luciferin 4-monooxygenase [Bicyclus anynana]